MHSNFILLIVSAFVFAGCGQAADTGDVSEDAATSSFDEVYAAAEKSLAVAISRRNVWSKTGAMLSDAKAAFDNGDVDTAVELATEARLQAELALTQADFEEDAWRTRVLSE